MELILNNNFIYKINDQFFISCTIIYIINYYLNVFICVLLCVLFLYLFWLRLKIFLIILPFHKIGGLYYTWYVQTCCRANPLSLWFNWRIGTREIIVLLTVVAIRRNFLWSVCDLFIMWYFYRYFFIVYINIFI